jgi:hypothetical protein
MQEPAAPCGQPAARQGRPLAWPHRCAWLLFSRWPHARCLCLWRAATCCAASACAATACRVCRVRCCPAAHHHRTPSLPTARPGDEHRGGERRRQAPHEGRGGGDLGGRRWTEVEWRGGGGGAGRRRGAAKKREAQGSCVYAQNSSARMLKTRSEGARPVNICCAAFARRSCRPALHAVQATTTTRRPRTCTRQRPSAHRAFHLPE